MLFCFSTTFLLTSSKIIDYDLLEVNGIEMVKQQKATKNSSTGRVGHRGLPDYRFPCSIHSVSLVPEDTELRIVNDLGPSIAEGIAGYFISGSLRNFKESYWSEPPHIAFANMRAEDPKAAESFTRRYGVLHVANMDENDPDGQKFEIDSAFLLHMQERLRQAWPSGDERFGGTRIDLEGEVEEGFESDVVVSGGFVHLRPKDLWRSVCFLYLWDVHAGKLGFCGNPDCPAPYFRKKRKTQKYCEQGPCVQYAQRQYSLDWWNSPGGGKERREKRVAKNQLRRKKRP